MRCLLTPRADRMPDPARHLFSIADLSASAVEKILARSRHLNENDREDNSFRYNGSPTVALLFREVSLRTRIGFAVATQRLGGTVIDVPGLRYRVEMSEPEDLASTVRVLSDMVDAIVVRTPDRLDLTSLQHGCNCALVNGGDGAGNHPTQALIDLLAIRKELGRRKPLTVGICGALSMRAPRSLLQLLAGEAVERVRLFAADSVYDASMPGRLEIEVCKGGLDCRGLDVLYMAGLPQRVGDRLLTPAERHRFALTPAALRDLPASAVVLSPMPVVDEIEPSAWHDPRVKVFEQSRDGVGVRMAVLEHVLGYM